MFKHKFVKQAPVAGLFGITGAGAATAGVAIVGTGVSALSAINSSQQQKKSSKLQQKMADVSAARERVQAARQARIARASILASAGNEGVGGSGVQGATASIGSQYGSNIGNMNVMQDFGQQISAANQKAADWQSTGATFQTIGNLAGGMTDWSKIFNPSGTPSVQQMANK